MKHSWESEITAAVVIASVVCYVGFCWLAARIFLVTGDEISTNFDDLKAKERD